MGEGSVFVSIVGKPNMGKSTLLNRLIGAKVAIISPKPQTTRSRILGILTEGETQFVFSDTPGFHRPQTRLGEHMVKAVMDSADDADAALFLTYPKPYLDDEEKQLFESVAGRGAPVILVINKSDTAQSKKKVADCLAALSAEYPFSDSIAVSAVTGDGLSELKQLIKSYAAEGPHFFPDDALTDQPERVIVAELVREQLLKELRDELPHGCAVYTESFSERADGSVTDIDVTIMCEKDSHKGMIIGKGGSMLKKIATAARLSAEDFLGCHVNLKCFVKVKEGWRDSDSMIDLLGL